MSVTEPMYIYNLLDLVSSTDCLYIFNYLLYLFMFVLVAKFCFGFCGISWYFEVLLGHVVGILKLSVQSWIILFEFVFCLCKV